MRAEGADRPPGPRVAGERGQLAVRHHLAPGHLPEGAGDGSLERRALLQVERHVGEVVAGAAVEAVDSLQQFRHEVVTHA